MSEIKKNDGKWAPWYVYAVFIVGANLLKQQMIAGVVPVWANVAITAVLVGLLVLVITAVYRTMFVAKQQR